jgi:putative acetyltransferase
MTDHDMPGITLRTGTDADLPAILDLWVAAWTATMPEIDFEARRPWAMDHFSALMAEGAHLTLAMRDGAVLGGTLVTASRECLDQLVVAPRAWGEGVARALVAQACAASPRELSLTVNQANSRAIRFYEREGFVRSGEGINPNSGLPLFHYTWAGPA